jgi:CubicO group peptidase (beta-lactamase class C family)
MAGPSIDAALSRALALGEIGIQVAAYHRGVQIVDAWAGVADRRSGRSVDERTLFPVFSVSKAVTSVALHIQAERGCVDYDQPVAAYWPEFGRNGKDRITVRQVLCHESGLPQMPPDVTPERMCDWDWMIQAIEDFTPLFEPGSVGAYQSLVYGWYVGEIVRRTDPARRPFGDFIRQEVCAPLGIEDLWMGIPTAEVPRVAVLDSELPAADRSRETAASRLAKPDSVSPDAPVHNRHEVWRACIPGAGAIMTARAGARFFAMLANGGELDGVRLLGEDTLRACTRQRPTTGKLDKVVFGGDRVSPPIGRGGFWLSSPPLAGGTGVLCHAGSGGSVGWADLDRNLAIVICHNRLFEFDPAVAGPGNHPYQQIWDSIDATVAELACAAQS